MVLFKGEAILAFFATSLSLMSTALGCSDRDYSVSISNFVQCVENNLLEFAALDVEQSEKLRLTLNPIYTSDFVVSKAFNI